MKSFKSILAILAIFAIAASSSFAANKFVVKGTEYSTLAAALAAATSGDTVDITAYDTQIDGGNGFALNGVSLVCSASTQAVVKFTGANTDGGSSGCFINAMNATIRNIKFVGPDAAVGGGLYANGTIVVDNCVLNNFKDRGIWGIHSDGTPLDLTVAKTFVTNINGSGLNFWHPGPVTTSAKVMLNHCTFYVSNADSPIIDIPGSWFADGNKGSDFTVKNSAFARSTFGGTVYNCSNDFATQKLDMLPINHTCNAYLGKSWQGATYDTHNVDGNWIFGPLPTDATDIVDLGNHEITQFVDAANGNFLLKKTNRLNGNADDGGNIGADQTANGKIIGDVIVRQDGLEGAFTDLKAACESVGGTGKIIQIQQFTAPFVLTETIALNGKIIVTATNNPNDRATIKGKSENWFTFFGWSGNDCGLKNVILEGDPSFDNQTALQVGEGKFTVDNCLFKGFGNWGHAINVFYQGTTNPITGTVTNSVFDNSGIYVNDYNNSTNFGPVTFNHCSFNMYTYTITGTTESRSPVAFDVTDAYVKAGGTCSDITIKNCILKDDANHATMQAYMGAADLDSVRATWKPAFVASYNAYIHPEGTKRYSWDKGTNASNSGNDLALGTGEKDASTAPVYAAADKGDYRIWTISPYATTGEGGTYMGAYAPVEKPTAAKGWTIYN